MNCHDAHDVSARPESLFAPALTGHSGQDESSGETGDNGQVQTFVPGRAKGVRGVDIARSEAVEAELNRLIERRSSREPDPDEQEEIWKASVRRYNARRREEMRAAWCEHHQGQAARLRTTLEALIANHEEQAERYRNQPIGGA